MHVVCLFWILQKLSGCWAVEYATPFHWWICCFFLRQSTNTIVFGAVSCLRFLKPKCWGFLNFLSQFSGISIEHWFYCLFGASNEVLNPLLVVSLGSREQDLGANVEKSWKMLETCPKEILKSFSPRIKTFLSRTCFSPRLFLHQTILENDFPFFPGHFRPQPPELPKARRGFMNRHLRQSYRARLVMCQCLRVMKGWEK